MTPDLRTWLAGELPFPRSFNIRSLAGLNSFSIQRKRILLHPPLVSIYCKKKVGIPVEVPLLQAESKCGGERRNSIETEGNVWRTYSAGISVEPTSLSWIPEPGSPFETDLDHYRHPRLALRLLLLIVWNQRPANTEME